MAVIFQEIKNGNAKDESGNGIYFGYLAYYDSIPENYTYETLYYPSCFLFSN